MRPFFRSVLPALLLVGLAVSSARAQRGDEELPLNFADIELDKFVQWVSGVTNTRFLYSADIKSMRVFLMSPTRIRRDAVFRLFESVMEYNGFILVPAGKPSDNWHVVKIVRSQFGRYQPSKIYTLQELEKIDRDIFISQVIPLKYVNTQVVQGALRLARVTSPAGYLVGIQGSNTLLVSDYAPNVKRIYEIIKLMDNPGPQPTHDLYDLEHADAESLVAKLQPFLTVKQIPGLISGQIQDLSSVKLIAFPRTNRILIRAFPEQIAFLKNVLKKLDTPERGETGGIHYYPLKHARASDIQRTLSDFVRARSGTQSQAKPSAHPTTIVADGQSNSLLISADRKEWSEIKKILAVLDTRRPQVLLEVAIVEVTPSDTLNLGIELVTVDDPAQGALRGFAATAFGLSNLVDATGAPIGAAGGLPVGRLPIPGAGFTSGATKDNIFQIPLLMRMLQTKINLRVLTISQNLTNDNQQAEFKVADAIPKLEVSISSAGNQTFQNIQFEEAGTQVKITPHISSDRYLGLDIEQKFEVFQGVATPPTNLPQKLTRSLKTAVTVPNHQTIILGGFVSTRLNETINKVPILGDLPIVGHLFKNTIRALNKTNIYIFITPHILGDPNFRHLHRYSHRAKVATAELGIDVTKIDPGFQRFRREYGLIREDRVSPLYMLEYRSPTRRKG